MNKDAQDIQDENFIPSILATLSTLDMLNGFRSWNKEFVMKMAFQELCDELRGKIGDVATTVRKMHDDRTGELLDKEHVGQIGEVWANLTLALRHLEDARMRIGKALQAYDGGVSVYDQQAKANGK